MLGQHCDFISKSCNMFTQISLDFEHMEIMKSEAGRDMLALVTCSSVSLMCHTDTNFFNIKRLDNTLLESLE